MIYKNLIRPILFKIDPEKVHDMALKTSFLLGRSGVCRNILKKFFVYKNKRLEQNILGIDFKNPIGLAAGFDKNVVMVDILPSIGFGFMEVGSITLKPFQGNPKPRLFRLPAEKSIIVNYGLCNYGADIIYKKLVNRKFKIPVGVSIARTNLPMSENEAVNDFASGFKKLKDLGDYLTINISCPNTFDNINFCDKKILNKLLNKIKKENKGIKPTFLKIKPDLSFDQIDNIIKTAKKFHFVKGFIISNLTKNRYNLKTPKKRIDNISLKGGLSGLPVKEKSNRLISYVYNKTSGKYIIIGCGGIFNAKDAYQKIRLGASLVQLVTGLIYEGPGLIKRINKGLVKCLERYGYSDIEEAIGTKNQEEVSK